MLYNMILQSGEAGQTIVELIEAAATAIEILAVLIIVFSIFAGMIEYAYRRVRGVGEVDPYRALKGRLGRSMLLGLECCGLGPAGAGPYDPELVDRC